MNNMSLTNTWPLTDPQDGLIGPHGSNQTEGLRVLYLTRQCSHCGPALQRPRYSVRPCSYKRSSHTTSSGTHLQPAPKLTALSAWNSICAKTGGWAWIIIGLNGNLEFGPSSEARHLQTTSGESLYVR